MTAAALSFVIITALNGDLEMLSIILFLQESFLLLRNYLSSVLYWEL